MSESTKLSPCTCRRDLTRFQGVIAYCERAHDPDAQPGCDCFMQTKAEAEAAYRRFAQSHFINRAYGNTSI